MATVTIQPAGKDSMMLSDAPNNNYGTATSLNIGGHTGVPTDGHSSLFYFDLSGRGITSANLLTATFSVYFYAHGAEWTTATVYASKVTRDTWTSAGVTWNKYDGTNNWSTAGGDYTTTNQASLSVDTSEGKWLDFTVTTLASDALTNVNGHLNLILRCPTGTWNNSDVQVYSSEYATNTTLRPKLTVTVSALEFPVNGNILFF